LSIEETRLELECESSLLKEEAQDKLSKLQQKFQQTRNEVDLARRNHQTAIEELSSISQKITATRLPIIVNELQELAGKKSEIIKNSISTYASLKQNMIPIYKDFAKQLTENAEKIDGTTELREAFQSKQNESPKMTSHPTANDSDFIEISPRKEGGNSNITPKKPSVLNGLVLPKREDRTPEKDKPRKPTEKERGREREREKESENEKPEANHVEDDSEYEEEEEEDLSSLHSSDLESDNEMVEMEHEESDWEKQEKYQSISRMNEDDLDDTPLSSNSTQNPRVVKDDDIFSYTKKISRRT